MSDLSSKKVLWLENGQTVDFAARVAPAFNALYFWTPWARAYPLSNEVFIGDGLEGVTRILHWESVVDEVDLVVIADVYFGPLGKWLASQGHAVWAPKLGEDLELDRLKAKAVMSVIGVEHSPGELITGMIDLRSYLSKHDDVWVKISRYRGDGESFHSENYDLVRPVLDELEHRLGGKRDVFEFVVEDAVDADVEFGVDTFTVDGTFPAQTFCGVEVKDSAFVGRMIPWRDIPERLRAPHEKLSEWLKARQVRSFLSSEVRVTEDAAPVIDWTVRAPTPPSEIMQEIVGNWPDILAQGAQGVLVDPESAASHGVCAIITSDFAEQNWQPVWIPESARRWVKLRNHCHLDGVDYVVPHGEPTMREIGAVVGIGNSLDEAVEHLRENAKDIKGPRLHVKLECLQEALEAAEAMKAHGVEI